MTVNQKLRIIRKEKGITTTRLADMVGVSQSSIVRYENGSVSYIPVSLLEKIAAVLDCSVSQLTEGDIRYSQTSEDRAPVESLSSDEYALVVKYRNLSDPAKDVVQKLTVLLS